MISRDKTEMLLHTRTHSFASNLVNSKLEFAAIHALGENISQIVSILHKLRQNVFGSSEFLNPLPSKVFFWREYSFIFVNNRLQLSCRLY